MTKILFVCLGNICRSPAAEAVFNHLVIQQGLTDQIQCESAGTSAYHIGEAPDPRMRAAGVRRGYQFLSVAQQFDSHRDFKKYDYIIVMDDDNYRDISALDDSKNYENKLRKMVSYSKSFSDVGVPDPYYGGAEGFEYVLDMLEEGCAQLLESLLAELKD